MIRSALITIVALLFAVSVEAGPVRWAGKKVGSIAKCSVVKATAKGAAGAGKGVVKGAAYVGKKAFKAF